MFNKFIRIIGGDPNRKTVDDYSEIARQINALEDQYEALSSEALRGLTAEFRARLAQDETLEDLLPEAFAAVREASKRTLGLRHYDVQLIGGITLHRGSIAEMRTGEGKTLVATLPLYLNALTGRGAHLITVNDYLARRDARWMAPIYHQLGMSVGVLQMAARTENGQKAFIVDLERESPHEDQHQLRMEPRVDAYAADITYGTNSEFGFDYLRDNMAMRLDQRVQRGHYFAIVDEVDNVLIDEARTPLIISGPASDDTEWYVRMAQVVRQLRVEDYDVNEKDRTVTLTEIGEMHVEELLGLPLRDPERPEDVTPEQARLLGYLEQALRSQHLFKRNKDYLVQAGKIIIVDEFTGRLMPGRRWSDGLHQAVEAKEGVRVQAESVTYATITIQNYFRMYEKLAGMSGTALTEAEEFDKIYKLGVLPIPTNLEHEANRLESGLVEVEGRDENGYKYRYYTRKTDPQKAPVFWRRKDYPDVVYRSEEAKFRAITQEILRYNSMGRPVLVGTTSVELSERLSSRLRAEPLQRLAQAILLRRVWMEANKREEDGRQIAELQFLNAPLQDLQVPEMRKLARDLSISFTPSDPENLRYLREALDLSPEYDERLVNSLKAGIQHQILNARKHDEEGMIIAGAGGFGAVTIATNMAGRGVDIRLGGELADDVLNQVRLLLRREDVADRLRQDGLADIDHLPLSLWPRALDLVDPAELRSRAEAVEQFRSYIDMEERVRQLGGLHVIGSERHEARRIDNQLRGRAARQGDPGSSRFYLSMEDDLMRMFGGQQADGLMQRLKVDDAVPIEAGLVTRIVEQSQTRVEGSNFDVRKHLLEYDDVLNSQRAKIYAQRDLIFTKEDLSEDVTEMLRTEVLRRVPEALQDTDGPWKLLGWLDSIQPAINFNGNIFPSFSLKLLIDHLMEQRASMTSAEAVRSALVRLAADALDAERDHLLHSLQELLDSAEERLNEQLKERQETLDTYIEGLDLGDEDGGQPRSSKEIVDELSGALRFPVRLNNEQMRLLRSDPQEALANVNDQVVAFQQEQAIKRLVGSVERRLEDALELNLTQALLQDWNALADALFQAVEQTLQRRRERLVGNEQLGGQIGKDLEGWLARLQGSVSVQALTNLLVMMPQGSRQVFDKKTHRRVTQRTNRLTYIYLAARLLEKREQDEMAGEVLEHLEKAHTAILRTWGANVWPRFAGAGWENLDAYMQGRLGERLGETKVQILTNNPLQSLDNEDITVVIELLGGRALTQVYRQLLLGVIGELWVEYLTQMEALRVSIGLEAYAQRDPLVQYKGRASELFANLLSSMRLGVVNRMFTFRPRELPGEQVGLRQEENLPPGEDDNALELEASLLNGESEEVGDEEDEETAQAAQQGSSQPAGSANTSRSQKRRRRRR
jgi:preprotein translocase subunit SecA